MAKNKKTLDELLQEAIVKDAPYEVPGNWVWSKLGISCKLKNGYAFKSINYKSEGIPILRISNIKDSEVLFDPKLTVYSDYDKCLENFKVEKGDLVIAMSGATTGKTGIYKSLEYCYLNQRVGNLKIINNKLMVSKYRDNIIEFKKTDILKLAYGGAQPNISAKMIEELEIPIPPLKEQERIVEKIEGFFEKLNKAKELIEEVRGDFEKRKASILEKAFKGELTEKWREENKYDYEWKTAKFDEIVKIKSNLVDPLEYLEFPHIAPDCIEKKTGLLLKYNTIQEDNVKSAKHKFFKGQIIYSKIRPYLSKIILAEFDGLCSADMYPIETNLYTKYLYKYMLSQKFLRFACNAGSRSLLPKINRKELGKIPVVFPPLEEQKEIVRILDKLLDEENKIEKLTNLQNQIELTKKSILAKAFRGELGTNNPGEESAIELLKEVLQEKL